MPSSKTIVVLFSSAAAAAVLPTDNIADRQVATTTVAPTASLKCDLSYCDASISWCHYWAGMTSYDLNLGPQPGEVRTSVGECGAVATSPPAVDAREVTDPPAPTTAPVVNIKCDHEYCDGEISWCFYWAGMTSYDINLGPQPGEVRTSVGQCGLATPAPEPTTA